MANYSGSDDKRMVDAYGNEDVDAMTQSKLDDIRDEVNRLGARCTDVKLLDNKFFKNNIVLYGQFDDRIPLDRLQYGYRADASDSDFPPGWYEGTRCINKWRDICKHVVDRIFPNGIPSKMQPNDQICLILESCTIAAGKSPHKCCTTADIEECNVELVPGCFAYDAVKNSLRDGMSISSVKMSDDGSNYSVLLTGNAIDAKLSRKGWISYLQEVEQLASCMIDNYGIASIWLKNFSNDDNIWKLELGFDLLSSPFKDDN